MTHFSKICIVVASPLTAHAFLRDQVEALSLHFDVTIAANFSDNPEYVLDWKNINMVDIPIAREIKPIKDISAIFKLTTLFFKQKFFVVHSITPKAGLLGMAAAFLAHIKIRIHTFTGQVWVTRKGIGKFLLKNFDRLLGQLSTHVYADSPSQRDFLVKKKIIRPEKIKVLADGSISGVDIKRFKPDTKVRKKIREKFSIPEEAVVLLFLGRLHPDKGVEELVHAFKNIGANTAFLMIVGPDENLMKKRLVEVAGNRLTQILFLDFTSEPEKIMAASDIFCLPSYREGFGSVVIEAAACAVPSVVSQIYGLTDAVEDGITGLFHPPGNMDKMAEQLLKLIEDPVLRQTMGKAAKIRAEKLFSQDRLTRSILEEYFMLTDYANENKS